MHADQTRDLKSFDAVALEPRAPLGPWLPRRSSSRFDDLKAAAAGSPESIEKVVRDHWLGAYRAAYLILNDAAAAQDVAQEAILSALRSMQRFDRRRRFEPWLHRITVNRALDELRARNRRPELSTEGDVCDSPGPARPSLGAELCAALSDLDPRDRAIVVLRHVFDYRAGEIGRMVGMSAGAVRMRLKRALSRLREELGEEQI